MLNRWQLLNIAVQFKLQREPTVKWYGINAENAIRGSKYSANLSLCKLKINLCLELNYSQLMSYMVWLSEERLGVGGESVVMKSDYSYDCGLLLSFLSPLPDWQQLTELSPLIGSTAFHFHLCYLKPRFFWTFTSHIPSFPSIGRDNFYLIRSAKQNASHFSSNSEIPT